MNTQKQALTVQTDSLWQVIRIFNEARDQLTRANPIDPDPVDLARPLEIAGDALWDLSVTLRRIACEIRAGDFVPENQHNQLTRPRAGAHFAAKGEQS
jgi:hypothetical protein